MLTLTVHNDEPIRDAVESGLNAFFETKSVLVDATDPLPTTTRVRPRDLDFDAGSPRHDTANQDPNARQ